VPWICPGLTVVFLGLGVELPWRGFVWRLMLGEASLFESSSINSLGLRGEVFSKDADAVGRGGVAGGVGIHGVSSRTPSKPDILKVSSEPTAGVDVLLQPELSDTGLWDCNPKLEGVGVDIWGQELLPMPDISRLSPTVGGLRGGVDGNKLPPDT